MNRSPVRIPEPGRIIAHERDLRRQASHQARFETRQLKEAKRETVSTLQATARDAERLREVNDFAEHFRRMAINERENRREAESEARRLAAEKREAEERSRQAEYELGRDRQLTEMAILQARLRQVEMDDRVDDEEYPLRRRPVRIVQPEMPFSVDRGTAVLRQAQEAERQRREDELHRMERDRRRGLPRRQRSITIFEDDTNRGRRHRI